MSHLHSLRVLDVSSNELTGFSDLTPCVALRELRASDNGVRSIDALSVLYELCVLDVRRNHIPTVGALRYAHAQLYDAGRGRVDTKWKKECPLQ